jgi:peptidoglycan/LPS O-acetylase OafA/YrhL
MRRQPESRNESHVFSTLKPRFEVLDSLRGICAVVVVLYHFVPYHWLFQSTVVSNGWMFVDFFFVLSGFVISASYLERLASGFSPSSFLLLRLGRVYPLHLFMIVLYLVRELFIVATGTESARDVAFSGHLSLAGLAQNISLLNAFGLSGELTWNFPSWSIGAEAWTYVLFLVVTVTFKSRAPLVLALCGLGAAATVAALGNRWLDTTFDFGFFRCVFGFSIGVVVHQLYKWVRVHMSATVWTLIECGAILLATALISTSEGGALTLAMPLLFGAIVWVFAQQGGWISVVLRGRPFLLLGTLSYSIYMTQNFVQSQYVGALAAAGRYSGIGLVDAQFKLTTSGTVGTLLTLSMLACVIALSWLTYRTIEAPGRALARRIADRR